MIEIGEMKFVEFDFVDLKLKDMTNSESFWIHPKNNGEIYLQGNTRIACVDPKTGECLLSQHRAHSVVHSAFHFGENPIRYKLKKSTLNKILKNNET